MGDDDLELKLSERIRIWSRHKNSTAYYDGADLLTCCSVCGKLKRNEMKMIDDVGYVCEWCYINGELCKNGCNSPGVRGGDGLCRSCYIGDNYDEPLTLEGYIDGLCWSMIDDLGK